MDQDHRSAAPSHAWLEATRWSVMLEAVQNVWEKTRSWAMGWWNCPECSKQSLLQSPYVWQVREWDSQVFQRKFNCNARSLASCLLFSAISTYRVLLSRAALQVAACTSFEWYKTLCWI